MSRPTLLNLGCGKRRHPAWTNADLQPESPEVLRVDLREPLPFGDAEFDAVYSSHVLEHLAPDAGRRVVAEMARVVKPGGTVRIVIPDLEGICRAYLAALEAAAAGDAEARERHRWMVLELVDQMARTQKGGLMLRWWQMDPVPAERFVVDRLGTDARATIAHFRRRRAESGRAPVDPERWDEMPEPSDAEWLAFRRSGESHRWMYDRVSLAELLRGAGFRDPAPTGPTRSRIPGWEEYYLDADPEGRPEKADSLYMEALR